MDHLYRFPIPDAEGIAKTKTLFLEQYGRELSDDEAYEILATVMRYLYLLKPDEEDNTKKHF